MNIVGYTLFEYDDLTEADIYDLMDAYYTQS